MKAPRARANSTEMLTGVKREKDIQRTGSLEEAKNVLREACCVLRDMDIQRTCSLGEAELCITPD
jgi:hypothetical protein